MGDELVTGAEIGRRLGISRERVRQLTARSDFPESLGRIGPANVWRWQQVIDWDASHRRQPMLEVESDGIRFRTVPERPGFIDVEEGDGRRRGAVAWPGSPILSLSPVPGGVVVTTARHKGEVRRNLRGSWTLQSAIRTVPAGDAWQNRIGDRTISAHRSKEAAMRQGRKLAREHTTEHIVHRSDGRIVSRDSYGRDSNPPRGGAMSNEQRHVVREGNDWLVKKPNAERASSRHATQREADQRAAEILRNAGGGERITHGRDGKIRSKDTIPPAHDPNPPRDKEH
jgi:hypothetical protein